LALAGYGLKTCGHEEKPSRAVAAEKADKEDAGVRREKAKRLMAFMSQRKSVPEPRMSIAQIVEHEYPGNSLDCRTNYV
jgi:hypothetical protein